VINLHVLEESGIVFNVWNKQHCKTQLSE